MRVSGRAVSTILVLDVDGTLRGPGELIGDGVAEFLREQVREGVGIVPCSGKSADELEELFSVLEVPIIAIGAENGGHVVHDPRGVARREVCMADVDGEALRKAREHIDRCRQCGPWIAEDPKRSIITRRFGNPARAVEKARMWRDHVGRLPYFRSRRIEVYTHPDDAAVDLVVDPQNTHKGLVVRCVRTQHHPHARIIVAGDGLNDLSMLRAPRVISVCPANALPEVQAVVRHAGGVIAQAPYGAGTMEALRIAMRMGRQTDLFDSAGGPA